MIGEMPFGEGENPLGKNYFLGFGINEYCNFRKLNNARKDIEDLSTLLVGKYTFDAPNIELIFDEKATRRNIVTKLNGIIGFKSQSIY